MSQQTPPQRADLLRAIATAERGIRAIASRLHLPGQDRANLIRIADGLARVLTRAGLR